jgi:hypothetical protein
MHLAWKCLQHWTEVSIAVVREREQAYMVRVIVSAWHVSTVQCTAISTLWNDLVTGLLHVVNSSLLGVGQTVSCSVLWEWGRLEE